MTYTHVARSAVACLAAGGALLLLLTTLSAPTVEAGPAPPGQSVGKPLATRPRAAGSLPNGIAAGDTLALRNWN